MENLEIWNKYKEVPSNAQKEFDNGSFKGTDINTMWRIKSLTEQFGPCGIGWYYDIIKVENVCFSCSEEIVTNAEIKLYIKVDGEWSKGISGVGGNKTVSYVKSKAYYKVSDEAIKMAVTDALGNACRNLGFGADIYWSNDKTKYAPKEEEEPQEVIGAEFVMPVGKYKGLKLTEIDKRYLEWFLENGTNEIIKANIRESFDEVKEIEI